MLVSGVVIPKYLHKALEYELFPDEVQKLRKIQNEDKEGEGESEIELKSVPVVN